MNREELGKIVAYRLRDSDVARANALKGEHNSIMNGDVAPMLITRDWGGGMVNGTVFLDGEETLWATSAQPGDGPGQYRPFRLAGHAEKYDPGNVS